MMRWIIYIIIGWVCINNSTTFAQYALRLKNTTIEYLPPITVLNADSLHRSIPSFEGMRFMVLQFADVPNETTRQQLLNAGIALQQYLPDRAYTAAIKGNLDIPLLVSKGVTGLYVLQATDKISERIQRKGIPAWAIKETGTADVLVHINPAVDINIAKYYFTQQGFRIIEDAWKAYHFISIRIPQQQINTLATMPFVTYIAPVAPDPKTFNYIMRANTRANILNADVALGGEGLKGKGVTIGIGDDADPTNHVDLKDRIINRAAGIQNTHGTHVAGIAAGGGIKDPIFQGVAPQATIVAQLFNGIFLNAGAYINDYHMMVTNNSWGNITGECDMTGIYDTYSRLMDEIAIQYPTLLHVFAAGNDGPFSCLGYPQQYHTIVSGHQSAKNVLSVGWSEKNHTVSIGSSVGPAADGRLKPEITSQGSGIRSTIPVDDYLTDWGTSMAAPNVAGGAALLIEKYRQLNAGADPPAGLVKAWLMNGAKDIEQPAPDFKSGYGFLNMVRSVEMVKNNRYFIASVGNSGMNTHSITVPPNTAQLKVMVYWHDPAAAIFAQNSLVNDIDLEVINGATTTLPWVLNANTTGVAANATRGADHINNSEQVTIDGPVAGSYTIRIKGTAINTGAPQQYFVVYDIVPMGVDLTYPAAGETFFPGEAFVINWDAYGGPQNTFTLQYSVDGGINWINIDNNIPATARQYNWTAPATTDKAMIRLLRNNTSFADVSQPFVVLGVPSLFLSSVQCEDYISIGWSAIAGATDYEVMMKKGPEMLPVAITTNNNYVFSGLNRDSVYYVSVQARINGKPGRRAVAVNRIPNNGNCSGSISDNDLKIDSIIAPLSGRKFTTSEITGNQLSVRIKNLDDAPVTGSIIQYSINGSAFITNTINATIPANGTYTHTFNGINFTAPGTYRITAVVKNSAIDVNKSNDTATVIVQQLPNPPVTLPVTDHFDNAPVFELVNDATGLPALDRWDFINATNVGRVRSFVNTGIAKSGNRALTLDVTRFSPPTTNYLIATYNLSNYASVLPADLGLMLEFSYKHHGLRAATDNRVWVRRSDTDAWIPVFSFDSIVLPPGEWRKVSVDLSATAASINPSASFQVRFGERSRLSMGDNISNDGITIDDVVLIAAPNDVALLSITSPTVHYCNNKSNPTIAIRFRRNKASTVCIPVKYQLDNEPVINECAPAATGTFTFVTLPDLSVYELHRLKVWVDEAGDTYHANDTIITSIYSKPIIGAYPYIEDFENSNGGWYAEGYRSTWEFGLPSSLKINTAASGRKAWKTSLRGQYNENEKSYLYSPCYDLSRLTAPYLLFNMALDIEQCNLFVCDKVWVEYSANGSSWTKLGVYGQGLNWYNRRTDHVWDSAGYTRWHAAGTALPAGLQQVQLRFVLESDAGVTREGVAIDDVQVFDQSVTNPHVQWRIAPNPVTSVAYFISNHTAGKKISLQLLNAAGQVLYRSVFTASGIVDKSAIDCTGLPHGMYVLQVNDGTVSKTFRLIK